MNLQNAMLDSGASHNLMPKVVMDQLGLHITRPYKDMLSFDSMKVKCLGLIKDPVVYLSQIPAKNMVMDVVVVDIPPKFGMLLSGSWAAKLKGIVGPWLWKRANIKKEKVKCTLCGRHSNCYWGEVSR
jgi:hypothetical protein